MINENTISFNHKMFLDLKEIILKKLGTSLDKKYSRKIPN